MSEWNQVCTEAASGLLAELSAQRNHQVGEIQVDLQQTLGLLSAAIEKLSESFSAIHEAAALQKDLVEAVVKSPVLSRQLLPQIVNTTQSIGEHVNAAITGLQFQDMTSQLITRASKHVSVLGEVVDVVTDARSKMTHIGTGEELHQFLIELNNAVRVCGEQIRASGCKSVSQTHMSSGDIELF